MSSDDNQDEEEPLVPPSSFNASLSVPQLHLAPQSEVRVGMTRVKEKAAMEIIRTTSPFNHGKKITCIKHANLEMELEIFYPKILLFQKHCCFFKCA